MKCGLCERECDQKICDDCIFILLRNVDKFLAKKRGAMPVSLLKNLVRNAMEVLSND